MIFRSNLSAPDLSPDFKLKSEPRPWSFGHDVPSDPDFEPDCGYWTHDEAAILYHVACYRPAGDWLDIGCRFGWTSAYIAQASGFVLCLDPVLKFQAQLSRFEENTERSWPWIMGIEHRTAADYFAWQDEVLATEGNQHVFDGFVIDADHDAPNPLNDAKGCVTLAKETAVIMLHDFYGAPIQDAVTWLLDQGWKARVYWTPNGVACCWRGDFEPPVHHGDASIFVLAQSRADGFNLARCS